MDRRVRRKISDKGKEKIEVPEIESDFSTNEDRLVDWTATPGDNVIQLLSTLSHRDRASFASTCRTWRDLAKSPYLWRELDLRGHSCDGLSTALLAPRCRELQKLYFRGADSVDAIVNIRAKNLREMYGDGCRKLSDAMLSALMARHASLECLVIGPDLCEKISSDSIKVIAVCCRKLRKLRLSGVHDVSADAINALAKHCKNLRDVGFIDCSEVDEIALGNLDSVRFLSVAGTSINWNDAVQHWIKLPNLIGLDVSRTDIQHVFVPTIFSSFSNLKVLCALSCPALEEDATFVSRFKNHKGKALLAVFTDILKGIATLFADIPNNDGNLNIFLDSRNKKMKDHKLIEMLDWLECIISSSLVRISESNPPGLDDFWLNQGPKLLLTLMQSARNEVQERAAKALATFGVVDDDNNNIDSGRANAVVRDGGIPLLLKLARSWREGLQLEAAKAIANLSANTHVAKAVAEDGGIRTLVELAMSVNRMLSEEAAGGLWNLSVGEEHKRGIAEAGGIKALIDLVVRWSGSDSGEGVLEPAVGALANLAGDDKCSTEVASQGGVHALVELARSCKMEAVQEQAARAFANFASHGDSNTNSAVVGQVVGALEALVRLISSPHDGVRQEAAAALWNLSFDNSNREAIAAAGGVQSLVALVSSCSNASHSLQKRAAGAIWGLSVSETNSIAFGRQGGILPLIQLAQSGSEDVQETAAGALWNLAYNPGNALRIVEEGGIPVLVHLCSNSISVMARFMSALALAYMFDGRMDEVSLIGTSAAGTSNRVHVNVLRRMALKQIDTFLEAFCNSREFVAAASSSAPAALANVADSARILEAGLLRCSLAEIGRFVTMLRNPYDTLKACAAFTLLQFTLPGGKHAMHHVQLLQNSGAHRVIRATAAAAGGPRQAKLFARIILRNLEHRPIES